jgi:N-acetylglucosaminyl-diphospho-decaprenol L-rhamnosyltransferase
VKVSAVVASHGHADELTRSLPALVPQVDETVVIANLPGSVAKVPDGVRVVENPRPLTLSANVNLGIASTSGEYVLVSNPDAVAEPTVVAALVDFADAHPRCGIAGPQLRWPDGTWQPSRRRFPTVRGTVVRRTPLRRLRPPYETQTEHYQLDERPSEPVQADWMLGAFLLMRRTMLEEIDGWDAGYRHYCEDIDLCYRAARAGWERWYVPDAVVEHTHHAVTDRKFLTRRTPWHLRGIGRFIRKHPERLGAIGLQGRRRLAADGLYDGYSGTVTTGRRLHSRA